MEWRLESAEHGTDRIINVSTDAFEIGRGLLGITFPFVSRRQAVLRFTSPTGSLVPLLSLESLSENTPTGVQPEGDSGWQWLNRGSRRLLGAGDKIALDKKLRPGTMFVVRHIGSRSAAPAAPAAAPSAQWLVQLGGSWRAFDDERVRVAIEAAWAEGAERVDVGDGRHINLRTMRQVRNDDPTKCRAVRREPAAAQPPAAQPPTAQPPPPFGATSDADAASVAPAAKRQRVPTEPEAAIGDVAMTDAPGASGSAPAAIVPSASSAAREYVVLLMIEEDEACARVLAACEKVCSSEVHRQCFQWDGTRHITLLKGLQMTEEDARRVHYEQPPSLPLAIASLHFKVPYNTSPNPCPPPRRARLTCCGG